MNASGLQDAADAWVEKYRAYRPRESLGFLTPAEFSARLKPPIPAWRGVLYVLSADKKLDGRKILG